MQVSTTVPSPEGIGPGIEKASSKKAGLFARLFAGLLRNSKNNHTTTIPKAGGEPSGPDPVMRDGRRPLVSGKKEKPRPGEESAEIFPVFPSRSGEAGEIQIQVKAETQEGSLPELKLPMAGGERIPAEVSPEAGDLRGEAFSPDPAAARQAAELPDPALNRFLQAEEQAGEPAEEPAGEFSALKSGAGSAPPLIPAETAKPQEHAGTKGQRKGRERVLEVQDLRSAGEAVRGEGPAAGEGSVPVRGEAEWSVELRPGGESHAETAQEGFPAKAGEAVENILARELHQNLNGDIVRHASIVLRDGNEGTIKLSLKPESLGNVKIHLEMAENRIAGHIIVENDEVLRAFERELRSLEQAFKDSGFAGATLDMAVSSDAGRNGAGGQWRGEEASPFYSRRLAASHYDAAAESPEWGFARNSAGTAERQINLLV
ncbi:MAG: flagellar hook-length control protein FliK [Treponema sp.]|jgi:hypothetical protein|nr:flagellar hook-length control protein FliK [Treponema sp.]